MNKSILAFIFGAAIGSLITWKVLKDKHEAEIEDIYARCYGDEEAEEPEKEEQPVITDEKPELMEYAAKLREHGYTNYSEIEPNENKSGAVDTSKPHLIQEDEYGDMGYEEKYLTYYADRLLADDDDDLVEDIDNTVGFDALSLLNDDSDERPDVIYVRNDNLETDYEISFDERKYMSCIKGD